ncbi:hypothetical protein [Halalkalicoccus ordinarius]|uniref:hypothetical protein n=1 Tax=Halalkalicoccus ordinarius TaxID=3116651 RepID=UPI00300EBDC6
MPAEIATEETLEPDVDPTTIRHGISHDNLSTYCLILDTLEEQNEFVAEWETSCTLRNWINSEIFNAVSSGEATAVFEPPDEENYLLRTNIDNLISNHEESLDVCTHFQVDGYDIEISWEEQQRSNNFTVVAEAYNFDIFKEYYEETSNNDADVLVDVLSTAEQVVYSELNIGEENSEY